MTELSLDSPVSGSVALTTITEVPMPAVSLRPRRLYCCWVNTGTSSFASFTYMMTCRGWIVSMWNIIIGKEIGEMQTVTALGGKIQHLCSPVFPPSPSQNSSCCLHHYCRLPPPTHGSCWFLCPEPWGPWSAARSLCLCWTICCCCLRGKEKER